jgi:hypothetical protein
VVQRLFDRELVLIAGTLRMASRSRTGRPQPLLRVRFKIVRTLKKQPNTSSVVLYNLSPENRAQLQEKGTVVVLEAGYDGNVHQVFSGGVDYASSKKTGTDWITTLQLADGGERYRKGRMSQSFKGPVKVGDVLQRAAEALGVEFGNLQEKIRTGGLRKAFNEYSNGIAIAGKAEKAIDEIAKAMGLQFSIQDGAILLLEPGETLDQQALRLAPGTGLVGSPEPGEDGVVKLRALLEPNLTPGRKVELVSKAVNGFHRIEKTVMTGDTWGGDWYADCEVRPV